MFLVDWARQAAAWTDANDTSTPSVMYLLELVILAAVGAAWCALRALRRASETAPVLLRAAWFCTATAPRALMSSAACVIVLVAVVTFFGSYYSALSGDAEDYGSILMEYATQALLFLVVGAVGLPVEAWLTYRHSRKFHRVRSVAEGRDQSATG